VKGIQHDRSSRATIKSEARGALLMAIGKARIWIEDLIKGRASSFKEIAKHEGKVERHIRFLAPLAFLSPKIITEIIDGSVPADLTITALTKALPYSWAKQQQRIGLTTSCT
jgi:site-specific DNA recombinase